MKSSILLLASLVGSALSSANVARAIDPQTMDPTKLSVLSVLHTAVPTGLGALPTGDAMPAWYQQLPEDVKSLLPKLYPGGVEQVSSVVVSVSASSTAQVSTPFTLYFVLGSSYVQVSSSAMGYSAALPSATLSVSHSGAHSPNGTVLGVASPTAGIAQNTSVPLPHGNRTQTAFIPVQTVSKGAKNALGLDVVAAIALGVTGLGFSWLA